MGLDYLKEGDYARSKEYLNKAVKLDPKLYWSWYALGLLEIDNPKGYAYLKRSTEENPDFPIPYYWMAYYYCRNNEDRKAVELFKKYIDLAQGSIGEEDRLSSAREILLELQSGKDGAILKKIRNKP
jgi:Tfp pilus assembly protein PilF